jgi:hypothetical protein
LTADAARGTVAAARPVRRGCCRGSKEGEVLRFKLLAVVAALMSLALSSVATGGVAAAETSGGDAREIAFRYIRDSAKDFGVTRADVAELAVTTSDRSKHNRVTHVNVQQQLEGLPVGGVHATVNIADNRKVIFAGGALRSLTPPPSGTATLDAA